MRIPRHRTLHLALAAALCGAAPAAAQIGVPASRAMTFEPRFGVGYVANMPNQFAGVSAHYISGFMGGLGIYVDAKFDVSSPEDEDGYIADLTAAEVEDQFADQRFHSEGSWRSVNVALMRPLAPQFVVYAGAGIADGKQYHEYIDVEGNRGVEGFYWVRDEEESGSEVNVLGGAMFQLTRNIAFQVGMESQPRGFSVGASYLVPLRR
jgi:opacity protein-like surface antigen